MDSIKDNILRVKEKISAAAIRSGREPKDITLIGVTKNVDSSIINEALKNGLVEIGENRVQELLVKYDEISPEKWHLIGHLQTNKVKYIVDKVSLIHSIDSLKLLNEIEKQSKKANIVSNVLIQVNISEEESKFGIKKENIYELIEAAEGLGFVKVRGLMAIAGKLDSLNTVRLQFDNMTRLYLDIATKKYHNVSMEYLSMGMSNDFELAIEAGSNMVRIGSIIFGKRKY